MNFKSIFQPIYLITVTLMYMVATIMVLTAIVVFAIVDDIFSQVKLSQKSQSQNLFVYKEF